MCLEPQASLKDVHDRKRWNSSNCIFNIKNFVNVTKGEKMDTLSWQIRQERVFLFVQLAGSNFYGSLVVYSHKEFCLDRKLQEEVKNGKFIIKEHL